MITVKSHWDPDGITSGYFTSFGVPDSEVKIGEYDKGFGYTGGLTNDDWMTDMKPADKEWAGNCIDHHLPHEEGHKYKLISDDVPATLIAWREFKDKIPKSEWWKLAIGLMGDGQPELIPTEVFQLCPSLLKRIKTSGYQSYGKWNINMFPIYKLLSSGINAIMRKGDYEQAFNLVKYTLTPFELYNSDETRIAKMEIKNDFKMAVTECEIIDYNNLALVLFHSHYRMSGYVASALMDTLKGRTVMAINKRNGSISLRGDLAPYYKDTLSHLEYLELGGHTKFMGGKLTKGCDTLINDLNEIL